MCYAVNFLEDFARLLNEYKSKKLLGHFAHKAALAVLKTFPNQSLYVSEAGFTPSGKIHLGNFNDICLAYAIAQILEWWGYKSKAIVAVDSRDPFRQAPIFAPDEFKAREKELRGLPFDEIEDPWDCHSNYAEHFVSPVMDSVAEYGIKIEFIFAHKIHTNPKYIELLIRILQERERVREIFNRVRERAGHKKLYPQGWIPYRPKCENCGRMDENVIALEVSESGRYVKYKCGYCGHEGEADVTKAQGKPPFRIDWPLRWLVFNVHFEPMGKDLMASGSSFDTGAELLRQMFNREPPVNVFYDFLYWIPPEDRNRTTKLKFSKRRGIGLGVDEWLKYAPPEVLKYIILRRQVGDIKKESLKHIDFSPLDIPSYVDSFDDHEKAFYDVIYNRASGLAEVDKERIIATYLLSQVSVDDIPPKQPLRVPYSVCIEIALWMESIEDGLNMLTKMGKIPKDADREVLEDARRRLRMAHNWVRDFLKFTFPDPDIALSQISPEQRKALKELLGSVLRIEPSQISMDVIRPIVKLISQRLSIRPKKIYEAVYMIVLNKPDGPPVARLFRREDMRKYFERVLKRLSKEV